LGDQHDAEGIIERGHMKTKQIKNFSKSTLSLVITASLTTAMSLSVQANMDIAEAELETMTVTANRSAANINESLATQVVITRADIERIQPKSVLDMLATVSGLDISTNGGRGQNSSVYMRGANASHTLVLLNGVRISSASLGSTNVQSIAPELIERIEIVKGPRAALWGSDAIGGVIQIFTRKLESGEYFASANFGSEGYQMLGAGVGIKHGDGFTSISVNHEESDGFDVKDDAETDDDGYSFNSLAINGQQQVSDALAINWLAQIDQGDTEYDNSRANESEINNHVWQISAAYQWQLADINNTTQVNIGQSRTSNIGYGYGTSKNEGNQFDTRRNQYSVINNSDISSNFQVNLGAELYQETLKGSSVYSESERDVTGVFAHTVYRYEKFSYELAARYDDVEGIDSETTFNSSIGYQLTDNTQVSFSAGTGFKAPTFNDLYYPLDSWGYVGNQDLVSETSKSYEISVKSQFDHLSIAVNVYKTDIENLIDWSGSDIDGNTTAVNVDDVEIQGAEFGLNYQGLGGSHQFNVSYIEAEDAATGDQLSRRAKEHANYQFDTKLGQADVYAELQYKGKRYEYLWGGGVVKLDSYSLVNLGVSYPVAENFKVQVKLNNAFDESYQTANGYFTQERVAYFGISYQN